MYYEDNDYLGQHKIYETRTSLVHTLLLEVPTTHNTINKHFSFHYKVLFFLCCLVSEYAIKMIVLLKRKELTHVRKFLIV